MAGNNGSLGALTTSQPPKTSLPPGRQQPSNTAMTETKNTPATALFPDSNDPNQNPNILTQVHANSGTGRPQTQTALLPGDRVNLVTDTVDVSPMDISAGHNDKTRKDGAEHHDDRTNAHAKPTPVVSESNVPGSVMKSEKSATTVALDQGSGAAQSSGGNVGGKCRGAMPSIPETVRLTVLQAYKRTLTGPPSRRRPPGFTTSKRTNAEGTAAALNAEEKKQGGAAGAEDTFEDFALFDHPEIALAVERLANSDTVKAYAAKEVADTGGAPKLFIAIICWDGLDGLGKCMGRDAKTMHSKRCRVTAPDPKFRLTPRGVGNKIFGLIPGGQDVWLWRKPLDECLDVSRAAAKKETTLVAAKAEAEETSGAVVAMEKTAASDPAYSTDGRRTAISLAESLPLSPAAEHGSMLFHKYTAWIATPANRRSRGVGEEARQLTITFDLKKRDAASGGGKDNNMRNHHSGFVSLREEENSQLYGLLQGLRVVRKDTDPAVWANTTKAADVEGKGAAVATAMGGDGGPAVQTLKPGKGDDGGGGDTSTAKPPSKQVAIHYLYDKGKRRKTEMTRDFSCPFCLCNVNDFKCLSLHLEASHDQFMFKFAPQGKDDPWIKVMCRDPEEGHVTKSPAEEEYAWFDKLGGFYTSATTTTVKLPNVDSKNNKVLMNLTESKNFVFTSRRYYTPRMKAMQVEACRFEVQELQRLKEEEQQALQQAQQAQRQKEEERGAALSKETKKLKRQQHTTSQKRAAEHERQAALMKEQKDFIHQQNQLMWQQHQVVALQQAGGVYGGILEAARGGAEPQDPHQNMLLHQTQQQAAQQQFGFSLQNLRNLQSLSPRLRTLLGGIAHAHSQPGGLSGINPLGLHGATATGMFGGHGHHRLLSGLSGLSGHLGHLGHLGRPGQRGYEGRFGPAGEMGGSPPGGGGDTGLLAASSFFVERLRNQQASLEQQLGLHQRVLHGQHGGGAAGAGDLRGGGGGGPHDVIDLSADDTGHAHEDGAGGRARSFDETPPADVVMMGGIDAWLKQRRAAEALRGNGMEAAAAAMKTAGGVAAGLPAPRFQFWNTPGLIGGERSTSDGDYLIQVGAGGGRGRGTGTGTGRGRGRSAGGGEPPIAPGGKAKRKAGRPPGRGGRGRVGRPPGPGRGRGNLRDGNVQDYGAGGTSLDLNALGEAAGEVQTPRSRGSKGGGGDKSTTTTDLPFGGNAVNDANSRPRILLPQLRFQNDDDKNDDDASADRMQLDDDEEEEEEDDEARFLNRIHVTQTGRTVKIRERAVIPSYAALHQPSRKRKKASDADDGDYPCNVSSSGSEDDDSGDGEANGKRFKATIAKGSGAAAAGRGAGRRGQGKGRGRRGPGARGGGWGGRGSKKMVSNDFPGLSSAAAVFPGAPGEEEEEEEEQQHVSPRKGATASAEKDKGKDKDPKRAKAKRKALRSVDAIIAKKYKSLVASSDDEKEEDAEVEEEEEEDAEDREEVDQGIGPPGTYYHARTCMPIKNVPPPHEPMTDSDDDEDLQGWSRENYRHLSDFEDVVKSEKLFMHDWNVFMRRYKPFGDKELPDAYHAFAHYRGKQLAADPELRRLFTLHLINAWDFSVIESSVIDEVLKVVQGYCSSLPAGLSSESLQGKKGKQKEAPPHGV